MQSTDLQESNKEWTRRLPDNFRKVIETQEQGLWSRLFKQVKKFVPRRHR